MLITNGRIITWGEPNQVIEGSAILIQDDRIAGLGEQREMIESHPGEEILDAGGQLVMPGNICAHTQFYGAFARGLSIPGPAAKDFPEILEKLWWPLDRSLRMDDVRASAQVMLVDAIRHGTTTLIDHHASPNAIDGSLDAIAEAVDQSGLRAVLCYEVTDRDGLDKASAGIDENVRFLDRVERERAAGPGVAGGRVAATFGLHAGLTLSYQTLERCREAVAEQTGFHIHVAEHEADEYDSLARTGLRVVDRLAAHGILGERTIAAHAVHVDVKEVEILAETGTWVTHQPRSNMNNGVGVAGVEGIMRAGAAVCLGTDGFSHTMWDEWKTAYLMHKLWHRDPRRMNGTDIVRMGVDNNARLANVFFPEAPLGVIREGAFADLILVDYHPFTPLTAGNLPWQIIFGFNESLITTTIASGKILMKDRRILVMDEAAVAARARELVPAVWKRYQEQFD